MNGIELANAILAATKLLEALIRIAGNDPQVWDKVKADYNAAVDKLNHALEK